MADPSATVPLARYALALTLAKVGDAGAALLPLWRALGGLGEGVEGWRLARAATRARRLELERLTRRLGWTPETLPRPDGWAGSPPFLSAVADEVFACAPRSVVEFGSGLSTLVVARALEMLGGERHFVSFDHQPGFAELTRRRLATLRLRAEVRSVGLVPAAAWGYAGDWYDASDLPASIDLLIVDGPPAWMKGGTRGAAAPATFGRLAPGGVVLLDDAGREGERADAARWAAEHPEIAFELLPVGKGLLRGVRRG